jgi:hypothetical protein
MHQVGYLPGISAGCTDNKTLKIEMKCVYCAVRNESFNTTERNLSLEAATYAVTVLLHIQKNYKRVISIVCKTEMFPYMHSDAVTRNGLSVVKHGGSSDFFSTMYG